MAMLAITAAKSGVSRSTLRILMCEAKVRNVLYEKDEWNICCSNALI
jgi:hypothetical protein